MPSATRRNLYVDAAATPQGVGIGIRLLIQEAQRVGSSEAWLVCHQNAQLEAHSQIGEILGKQRIDALRKHQPVPLEGGAQLVAYTERHLPAVGNGSPVVVVHTNAKLLDKLDSLPQVPSLIVVPWNADADTRAWHEKRKPEIVGPPGGESQ